MSSRPSVQTPVGATVTLNIPPEWFINISVISRKTYNQGVFVQTSIEGSFTLFKSDYGSKGPMKQQMDGSKTFPITAKDEPIQLDLSFYYSNQRSNSGPKLKNPEFYCSKLDVQSSAKPPGSSDDMPDYVTYFIFVEDTPDSDQAAGSGQFDDAVAIIYVIKTNPNPIPPPPPDNVIKPYNPILDRPYPSTIDKYLQAYDVAFLIDDSGSMQGDKWAECRNALDGLANKVLDSGFDANGIDLYFLNSNDVFKFRDEIRDVQDKGKVAAAINKVNPNSGTPTGQRVAAILNAYLDKLDAAKNTPAYAELKPLDLIVITDGIATDGPQYELTSMLVNAGARVKAGPHHPNVMGVQFVQIGSDATAKAALEQLVLADTGNMVDTVPYAGPGSISPDKIERILLGGLHPNIRALRNP